MAASELLAEFGLRLDGRKAEELRNIKCRLGVFGQADGSAYLEQGATKVLAAVYGPREPRQRGGAETSEVKVNCQYSMAVFSTSERKKRPRGDRKSQEMSQHLRQTFEAAIKTELYPRSQIDIFVEVGHAYYTTQSILNSKIPNTIALFHRFSNVLFFENGGNNSAVKTKNCNSTNLFHPT